MILADTVRLALTNLGQSKLRTGLTALGVSIGIASLAGMVSLGVGLQEQFVGRFLQAGVFDAITVTSPNSGDLPGFLAGGGRGGGGGGGGRGFGRGGRGPGFGRGERAGARSGSAATVPPLDDGAIAKFAAMENVKAVYPNIRVPVQVRLGDVEEFATVVGVPPASKDEGAFRTMTAGAFFPNDTEASCLLSLDMIKRLSTSEPSTLIGQTLTLSYAASVQSADVQGAEVPAQGALSGVQVQRIDRPYRIAGIVAREPGAGLGGFGISGVMSPIKKALEIDRQIVRSPTSLLRDRAAAPTYASVTVKVRRAQFTQDVEDRIKGMDYVAFSLNDALQGAKRAFIILDIVLSLIGSIALAVSSLGIVNTMVMSILERTREIGEMKAIGASDGDIRRIFLVEASAIGLLGGVAGVVLGWGVGRAINFGANIYIAQQGGETGNLFSLPVWLVAGAIGFSWLVSLLAGSYPAGRAARLNPIQALRHD